MMTESVSCHVCSFQYVVNSPSNVVTKFEVRSIDSSGDRTGERMEK